MEITSHFLSLFWHTPFRSCGLPLELGSPPLWSGVLGTECLLSSRFPFFASGLSRQALFFCGFFFAYVELLVLFESASPPSLFPFAFLPDRQRPGPRLPCRATARPLREAASLLFSPGRFAWTTQILFFPVDRSFVPLPSRVGITLGGLKMKIVSSLPSPDFCPEASRADRENALLSSPSTLLRGDDAFFPLPSKFAEGNPRRPHRQNAVRVG